MGYKLNKTDGTLLVDLVDGQLDTTTTSIGLIGKNYTGFGETLNENMIKMLENFANTSAPSAIWTFAASASFTGSYHVLAHITEIDAEEFTDLKPWAKALIPIITSGIGKEAI